MDTIDDLFYYLEENALACSLSFMPVQLFTKIHKFIEENRLTLKPDQISALECECKVFLKNISDGKYVNESSDKHFSKSDYEYLKNRLKIVKNPYLIARYSHILLLSDEQGKHLYVPLTVDNYLLLVDYFRTKHDKDQKNTCASVLWALKNALTISMGFNNGLKQTDVKRKIFQLILTSPTSDPFSSSMIAHLLQIMIEQTKLFSISDFEKLDQECIKHATVLRRSQGVFPDSAIQLYHIGEKIDEKMGIHKTDWNSLIAETYEELTINYQENPLVAIEHCQNSIKYFKRTNNKIKKGEMEQKFIELRSKIQIPAHKIPLESDEYTQFIQDCEKEVQRVVNESPEYILKYLTNSPNVIPNLERVEEGGKVLDGSISSQLFSGTVLDQFGNTVKIIETSQQKSRHNFYKTYRITLENYTYRVLHGVIINGIKTGKITKETVMEHLNNYSWISTPLLFQTMDGQTVEDDWKRLIEPSISLYLLDLNNAIKSDIPSPNFILPIDSLTLKFEGMMRDLCGINKISTVKHNTQPNSPTSEEKNLNDLLFDPKISNFVKEDDLTFYKFVFVEKDGYNLRNNVAHSLLRYEEYHLFFMNLIFLAVLRLTKGRLTIKETGNPPTS